MNAPAEDRTHEVTHFHAKSRWLGVMSTEREPWLKARSKLVTASGVAALLGLHPRLDSLGLYAEIVMQKPVNDIDMGLNSPVVWGSALEEAVCRTAAKHLGWDLKMSGALLVSRAYPDIGATLDAEAIENSKPFVCECKTTSAFKFKDWSEDDGRAPDHILIQAQSQLLVTGADLCRIICLIGGQRFCKVEVYPSDELQNMIIEHVEEFMERVHALDPPPATFRSTDALKLLYPTDDGSMVLLPPESVEWLAEYQELTAKIKESTEDKDELGNKLKAAIGECTFGVLPCEVGGKTVLKYAVEEKQEYTVRAQSNRVLRQLKQLGKGKK